MRIVTLHENDPARGACAFGHFFKSTPIDFISKGLYDAIALAMHTGEYRQVFIYREREGERERGMHI